MITIDVQSTSVSVENNIVCFRLYFIRLFRDYYIDHDPREYQRFLVGRVPN